MADKKISDLTAATGVNYTDTVPIVQTGSTKKIAMSLFALRWNATSSKWDANSSKIAGVAAGVADDETPIMAQIGYSYLSMSGNVTLTSADRRFWIFDPNGSARTVTLPTTNVTAGDVYEFTNTSSTYLLTINASGGSQKTNILNGTVRLVALQNTPTTPSHWRILSAESGWTSYTPSFSAGFGTPSGISFFWKRAGSEMKIKGLWTNGTVAASACSITVPASHTINSSAIPAKAKFGLWVALNTGGTNIFPTINGAGVAFYNSGLGTGAFYLGGNTTSNDFQASTGSSILTSSIPVSLDLEFPVTEWTP